ncbi:MAG: HD-GYP domain-containing protein [Desulfovibrio sp.]
MKNIQLPIALDEKILSRVSGEMPVAIHQFSESLGNAIDAKDHHTSSHSEEVAEIAKMIALEMRLSKRVAEIIHVAGHLHDIGKIGIPDSVLQKNGALNDEEWRLVREHPAKGAEIIYPVEALRDLGIVKMVRHHHERYDGCGYPDGLKGKSIPLGARVITLADSLSAMTQDRPYRAGCSFVEAKNEIVRCCGRQFDPCVVRAFWHCADEVDKLIAKMKR